MAKTDEYFELYGYPPFTNDIQEYWKDWKMNNNELLSRIDERTLNMWKVLEKLEKHQAEANGFIRDNMRQTTRNATWILAFKWVIGLVILALIGTITAGIIGVW